MSKQGVTEARQDWIVCAPVRRAALVKGPSWSMATGPLSLSCVGRAQTGPIYLARIFRHPISHLNLPPPRLWMAFHHVFHSHFTSPFALAICVTFTLLALSQCPGRILHLQVSHICVSILCLHFASHLPSSRGSAGSSSSAATSPPLAARCSIRAL